MLIVIIVQKLIHSFNLKIYSYCCYKRDYNNNYISKITLIVITESVIVFLPKCVQFDSLQ